MRKYLPVFFLLFCSCQLFNQAKIKSEPKIALNNYKISAEMEILKPINVESLTTDWQVGKVLSENSDTARIQVEIDPVFDQMRGLIPNPNWRSEYFNNSELANYLKPGITTNWDYSMKKQLIIELAKDGIDVTALDDIELVRKVSSWIFGGKNFHFKDFFISFDLEFKDGNPVVIQKLMPNFENEKSKNGVTTNEKAFAIGVFGKSMFESKLFGNCTSSATLQATIMKALGIPSRLVLSVPLADANERQQINLVANSLHQFELRKSILSGLINGANSWSSHTFNEVYVGNKWV